MLACTRMAYAFARDSALPFSSTFSRISPLTQTPLFAVWLVVLFSSALNLIGIGSTLTIVAIFNITAPALDLSYATVILARNVYEKRIEFRPGPYTLGEWQKPLNATTCSWVFFISIVLLFPTIKPVTKENMNYAVVVGAVIGVFSLGWWWGGARRRYKGPETKEILTLVAGEEEEEDECVDEAGSDEVSELLH